MMAPGGGRELSSAAARATRRNSHTAFLSHFVERSRSVNASEEGKRRTGREGEGAGAEQILRMSRGRLTRGKRGRQAERIYTTRSLVLPFAKQIARN